jgi:hypothetical protein
MRDLANLPVASACARSIYADDLTRLARLRMG